MSRLDFAPETDAMEVTDIASGHFVFAPLGGEAVSFSELREAIEGAGYKIERASIEVSGTVLETGHLQIPGTDQVFHLQEADTGRGADATPPEEGTPERPEGAASDALEELRQNAGSGTQVTVFGRWRQERDVQIVAVERWSPKGGSWPD